MSYVVVRIRGQVDVRRGIKHTLSSLGLHKKFNATIVPRNRVMEGMLYKAKDYITWGTATAETVQRLLSTRGRTIGNKPLTEEYLREKMEASEAAEVFNDIARGRTSIREIPGLKPVLRLSPPRGGFKGSTKRPVTVGGELGYRENIEALLQRML